MYKRQVLELHLKSAGDEKVAIAEKLLKSLYVDNCASSVATYDEFQEFREQATQIMADAKFELRGWECTLQTDNLARTPPLRSNGEQWQWKPKKAPRESVSFEPSSVKIRRRIGPVDEFMKKRHN